jgi:hypothetical protein
MKLSKLPCLVAAATLLAPACPGKSLLSLLFPRDRYVITNSDVLVEEASIPRPTRDKPVYYVAVSAGYRDFGAPIAGGREPDQKAVLDLMTKTLASQGYRLATNHNPPTLMIVYAWGTLYANSLFLGDSRYPNAVLNRGQILDFVGGFKMGVGRPHDQPGMETGLAPGLSLSNPDASTFYEMGSDNYYAISIAAYDLQAAKEEKAVALWKTRISCPANRHYLDEVLPAMLSVAAPNIGRQMNRPVMVDVADHYVPEINVGIPTVVEEDVPSPRAD